MGGQTNGTWTPTKRRGPIAAEFTTPGPASITLPSTIGTSNSTKVRSPAFSMSGRHEMKLDKAGPGPGQYNVTGISNKGKDEAHAPSMHIKPTEPKPYVTPAPGDYCPEKAEKKVVDTSPAFSFGIKADPNKVPDYPAPNRYSIPSLLGPVKEGSKVAAPCFSMGIKPKEVEDKMKVPGPGTYDEATVDKYKIIKSPAFSMGQRTAIPSDHTQKPGPGAHSPEKYQNGVGPMFTMGARGKEEEDRMKIPGPGTYEASDLDVCKKKNPVFTMSPKTILPADQTIRPAPNAYSVEKCEGKQTPEFSFGIKHSPYLGHLRNQ